jgi:hypothetical protein
MKTSTPEPPIVVSKDGTAGPYITVSTDQLETVIQALNARDVSIQVDEDAVMIGARRALVVIDLGHDADVEKVQGILDGLTTARPTGESQQELIVKCRPSEMRELLHRIDGPLPACWKRRTEIEQRMRKLRRADVGAYCFSKTVEPIQQEVAVWLQTRGAGELAVTSIIPLQQLKSLSVEQHNQVLDDFEKTLIEPASAGLRVRVLKYPARGEPTLQDVLSPESMRRLTKFSANANKRMLQPLDSYRWSAFIAHTHLEDVVVDLTLLSDWLESEGWPEDQRLKLTHDYEVGRSVLSTYDEERLVR